MDHRLAGLLSVVVGPILSECFRRPLTPQGILWWSHFFLLTLLGYYQSPNLIAMDPFFDSSKASIVANTCFVLMFLGWIVRFWAVSVMGSAMNLRFTASGAQSRGGIIQTGPYQYVRHPGTASFFLTGPTAALVASGGSLGYGMLVLIMFAAFYVPMCLQEEGDLVQQLPKYRTYMQNVPFRFFPGIY